MNPKLASFASLFLALWLSGLSQAQIKLPDTVPTTGCIGNAVGTAKFTSTVSAKQGYQTIAAGKYWDQAGAVWEFSVDGDNIVLANPGIPGAGAGFNGNDGGAANAEKALKLSDNKKTLSLSIPSPALGQQFDINFSAGPSSAGSDPTSKEPASPTWTAGACKTSVLTEKPVTCGGSVQQPLEKTKTVCACPSDILLLERSGGDDPCSAYTSAQGDLVVPTNACPSPPTKAKRAPADNVRRDHAITEAPVAPYLVGAKFRPKPRQVVPDHVVHILEARADQDASVNIVIKANWPCQGPPEPSKTQSGPEGEDNTAIASLCENNKITPGPEAWTTYEVPKYMSSLLANADPNLPSTSPFVDGIEVIKNDVNPPGAQCTYTAKCDAISCTDVRDHTTGKEVTIQRFLGYTAVVNLNNYIWSVHDAIYNAGTIASLVSGEIVKTFFTNPTPDATWMQILGIFGGLLGMISGMLAPFLIPSAAAGIASGIIGVVGSIATIENISPVADKRFDETADITKYFGDYIQATDKGLQNAYDSSIGKATAVFEWTGSDLAPDGDAAGKKGIFGDGIFADSDYTQGMTDQVLQRMIKIMTYKAVNSAWTDSGVFIIYVPYGRDIKGPDGNMIKGFSADWCKNTLKGKSLVGKVINCDAGDGMAAIFNAADGKDSGALKDPQGIVSKFNVLPDSPLNYMSAIAGSVASWRAGDFGYDASDPYKDAFNSQGGITADQAQKIAQLKIQEDTAGFFNIPVCQTFDLRYFPYAMDDKLPNDSPCLACGSKVAVGGKQGSTVKFMDKANDKVKDTLQAGGGTTCGGYYGNSCSNKCPEDVYTG